MDIIEHAAGLVAGPGLFRMPAGVYHADPAPEPSLSSSVAKLLIERSPEHARVAHPRLAPFDPDAEPSEPTRAMQVGSVTHKLVLGEGAAIEVIDADDFRRAVAKEARAAALAAGRLPILRPDHAKAKALADAIGGRLVRIEGCEGFATAPAEVVAVAQDRSGAWLRIMMDRIEIHPTHAIIWDLKTSEMSAAPQGVGRRIEQMQMEIQGALYAHVLSILLPHLRGRIRFRWIFAEVGDGPHGVTVAEADGAGLEIGQRKVAAAISLWNRCRASGEWPGYAPQIVRAEYPEYAARRWSAREEADPALAGANYCLDASPYRPLDWRAAA